MSESIRLASVHELAAWQDNLRVQIGDNGRDGAYFSTLLPANIATRFTAEKLAEAQLAAGKSMTEPGWLRVFVLEHEGAIVGHADLKGGIGVADLHRCTLGIGLQRAFQGRGRGEALLRAAIAWARTAGLSWMDLAVFDGNARAHALYLKLGFVEVGRVADRYRIDGRPLTDILMALDLAAP